MAKLFANNGDPDQVYTVCQLPFYGSPDNNGLTSPLVVKVLTVLVSTISNSQVFLLKINLSSFCKCKNINVYTVFNDQSFNDTLTNDIR